MAATMNADCVHGEVENGDRAQKRSARPKRPRRAALRGTDDGHFYRGDERLRAILSVESGHKKAALGEERGEAIEI
jgi:hypothetical protein